MPNDPNGDLQIKPVGSDNTGANTASGVNSAVTSAGTGGGTAQPVGQTATITDDKTPVNKRAFDLAADVETSATGMAKPEKFAIPKIVKEKHPDLIDLIKETESMDDEERQYWFQILPVMTDQQIEKFKTILVTEKEQLAELDQEYEQELNRLNEKHLVEWKEFETKEKSKAIKEAEAKNEVEEAQMEEDLLAKLSDV